MARKNGYFTPNRYNRAKTYSDHWTYKTVKVMFYPYLPPKPRWRKIKKLRGEY